jgi:acetoin utilization protein AcuB
MFVREFMTRKPVTVRPDSDPLAALALLRYGGFRHLPVIDSEDRLVGIVSHKDLEMFLSTAASPGVVKRHHLIDQVMIRDVVTTGPECPLEEAADRMVTHKISSLPVMEGDRLIGIITETDIFNEFAAVLGGGTDSLRLTVQMPNIPGQLADLAGRIARVHGNITSVVAYNPAEPGRINIVLRIEGSSREDVLGAIADQPQFTVLNLWDGEGC